jgi:hypothetical protein
VKRAIVMAISVLLALIVAAPIASGQSSSQSQTIGKLTGDWWNWAVSTNPSPLEGSYTGGTQCDGSFVDGVFFLGGSQTKKAVKRTCTVPANTPILFPVVNTARPPQIRMDTEGSRVILGPIISAPMTYLIKSY